MRQHRESPISPLLQAVDSLAKGMAIMGHKSELQAREIVGLWKAIDALAEQRKPKKKYNRTKESLTVGVRGSRDSRLDELGSEFVVKGGSFKSHPPYTQLLRFELELL
jgi:hypothetical protein